MEYTNVDDIPNLIHIKDIDMIESASCGIVDEVLKYIKDTYGKELTLKGYSSEGGFIKSRVTIGDDKYVLEIYTGLDISDLYDSMCLHILMMRADSKKCLSPILVPLLPCSDAKMYYVCKFVYDKYCYQVRDVSYKLSRFEYTNDNLVKFTKALLDKIQRLHDHRFTHGDLSNETLVLLYKDDPSSVCIKSSFRLISWVDKYGNVHDQHSSLGAAGSPLTCSRNVHSKMSACRYDDLESLLYLICSMKSIILPWSNVIALKEVNSEKNRFLNNPEVFVKFDSAEANRSIKEICNMIINADYEDKPIYTIMKNMLISIAGASIVE
jgi:hypothetical protein